MRVRTLVSGHCKAAPYGRNDLQPTAKWTPTKHCAGFFNRLRYNRMDSPLKKPTIIVDMFSKDYTIFKAIVKTLMLHLKETGDSTRFLCVNNGITNGCTTRSDSVF